jgi:bacteriocin-like protein
MTDIVETLSDDELAHVAGGYGCAGNTPKGGYGDNYRLCNGIQQSASSSSGLQHEPVHAS